MSLERRQIKGGQKQRKEGGPGEWEVLKVRYELFPKESGNSERVFFFWVADVKVYFKG